MNSDLEWSEQGNSSDLLGVKKKPTFITTINGTKGRFSWDILYLSRGICEVGRTAVQESTKVDTTDDKCGQAGHKGFNFG